MKICSTLTLLGGLLLSVPLISQAGDFVVDATELMIGSGVQKDIVMLCVITIPGEGTCANILTNGRGGTVTFNRSDIGFYTIFKGIGYNDGAEAHFPVDSHCYGKLLKNFSRVTIKGTLSSNNKDNKYVCTYS